MASELRQDATTGDWVILAPERRARPQQHASNAPPAACPLCPGHEAETPPAIFVLPADGDEPWAVRVVPNAFPALAPMEVPSMPEEDASLFRAMAGAGRHELVVDTPRHQVRPSAMSPRELERVLHAYHARSSSLAQDPRVAAIIIVKNVGPRAGASLPHPHSQVLAMPLVPNGLARRYAAAARYYRRTGRCVYMDLLTSELEARERVVLQNEHFVAYCPFASAAPLETWILPRRPRAAYGDTTEEERRALAQVLRATLGALDTVLQEPDFNYVLHSSPTAEPQAPYYLWHLQITPRISTAAGIELGVGLPINVVTPEAAAASLRQVLSSGVTAL